MTQISHVLDFEYWKIYSGLTVKQMKEREKSFEYPPRLQIKCKQIEVSKPLYFSFKISKRSRNMDNSKEIAQFSLHKEVAGTGVFFNINIWAANAVY